MKNATYTDIDGSTFTIMYDPNDLCRVCGLPVREASVSGTDICPWCDMGKERPDKGNNVVTFIYKSSIKKFKGIPDSHPYFCLNFGDEVEMVIHDEKVNGRVVNIERSKAWVGWEIQCEIE